MRAPPAPRPPPVIGRAVPLATASARAGARGQASRNRRPARRPAASAAAAPLPTITGPRPIDAGVPIDRSTYAWRGHTVAYARAGPPTGPPVVLLHGFGASAGHWRKLVKPLTDAGHAVYAPDLLGFGASDKPALEYSTPLWRDLVLDFVRDIVQADGAGPGAVLVGNSLGSLVALLAAAAAPTGSIAAVALVNVAGGMNNKAASDDWRIALATPIFALIDFLLSIPPVARALFDSFRKPDTLQGVLESVYGNKDAVDAALVDLVAAPAGDEGALAAFVSIISGDPGPRPETAVEAITCPLLFVWGDPDPFTPVDGPVGQWARGLATSRPDTAFALLPGVGHCPQDDDPAAVAAVMVPWLARVRGW